MSANSEHVLEQLFATQERLYKAGARNFLFIDVPTVHRSAGGKSAHPNCLFDIVTNFDYQNIVPVEKQTEVLDVIRKWNTALGEQINRFSSKYKDATVLLFSAFRVFEVLLDDPESFGLDPADLRRRGGSIWMDHIHPTSAVHDYIASNIADFLSEVPSKKTT